MRYFAAFSLKIISIADRGYGLQFRFFCLLHQLLPLQLKDAERRRNMRDQVLDPICRVWEHKLYFQEKYGNIGKIWKNTPQIRSIRAWIRPDKGSVAFIRVKFRILQLFLQCLIIDVPPPIVVELPVQLLLLPWHAQMAAP